MKMRSSRRLLAAPVPLTSISIRPAIPIEIVIVIPTKITNPTPAAHRQLANLSPPSRIPRAGQVSLAARKDNGASCEPIGWWVETELRLRPHCIDLLQFSPLIWSLTEQPLH
jgi:hypothetical protein